MKFRCKDKIPTNPKPRFKVKACSDCWSFSYMGEHTGAIWYDGSIGGICA